jgi:hypothetical protein
MIPDVILRRLQATPIGRRFDATGIHRDQLIADPADAGLAQQSLNDHFRLLVGTLAKMMMSDAPL